MLKQQDLNQKITKSTDTKITIKVVSHVIKIINQKYFSHAGKYSISIQISIQCKHQYICNGWGLPVLLLALR